jgi:hypothetical protein
LPSVGTASGLVTTVAPAQPPAGQTPGVTGSCASERVTTFEAIPDSPSAKSVVPNTTNCELEYAGTEIEPPVGAAPSAVSSNARGVEERPALLTAVTEPAPEDGAELQE